MALVWADFPSGQKGLYGATESFMLNGIWSAFEGGTSNLDLVSDPDPTIGSDGIVLKFDNDNVSAPVYARFTYPEAVVVAGVSFRAWLSALPSGDSSGGNPQWEFRNISNTLIARMRIGASGQFLIYNAAGTLVYTSDPAAVTANAFNHIETKVLRDAALGTIEVRVNGVPKVDIDAQVLGANNIVNIAIGQLAELSGTIVVYYKDIIFWDGLGDYVNDFQGAVAVHDLLPSADISLGWTPSSGATGFNLVDEGDAGPVDSDYISADNTLPAPAVFEMTDLPPDVVSIRAVMPIGRLVKTDGGDCNVLMRISPNGVDWDPGDDRPITIAPTYWWDKSYLSPDTAAAWTPSEVDDIQFEIDRTL